MSNTIKPEDFFSNVPPERIIGTECEYNLQLPGSTSYESDLEAFISPKVIRKTDLAFVANFASNGSKIYKDMNHLEYSTPECLGPLQAAAADMAGILVMQNVVNTSGLEHNGLYRLAGTSLRAQDGSVESQSTTNGYHENFQFPRSLIRDKEYLTNLNALITAHLVSRIWNMSGTVRSNYVFSQKAWGLGEGLVPDGVGNRTVHGKKPMVTIPNERFDNALVGSPEWARLEVRFADAGIEPDTKYIGLASTSLVLRLVEHADCLDDPNFADILPTDPLRAVAIFAGDLSMLHAVNTEGKMRLTALDIQDILLDYVTELDEKIDLPRDERNAIDSWIDLVDGLRHSRPDLAEYGHLTKSLDVAARHYYLSHNADPDEINDKNPKVSAKNLLWDRVLPEGGAQKWWGKFPAQFVTDKLIRPLITTPPQTRAAVRARRISRAENDISFVDWGRIEYKNHNEVYFPDPYNNR